MLPRLRLLSKLVWRRRWLRRSILSCALLGAVVLVGSITTNLVVVTGAADHRYADVDDVPSRPVAIVLGAGVTGSHPTPALASRLDGAIALFEAKRVQHLLMTGDNGRDDYDEVTVMRDYVVERGVPASAITRDYAGFDTYDSCYRARHIFGVTDAVVVTQDFHLARAVYTCRQLGIDAVGFAIPDWNHRPGELDYRYRRDQEVGYTIREWLARTKAVVEIHVTRPTPRFLGPFEGLAQT